MNSPMAFRATYADWKLIKTRGVVQVVMEVPLADSDAAYDVLGGMPNPANETWFGIAPIKLGKEAMPNQGLVPAKHNARPLPESDKPLAGAKREKMDWRDVQPAAQAGIRCGEATFRAFLNETRFPDSIYKSDVTTTAEAAEAIRNICGVHSRAELSTKHAARIIWHQLDTEYQAWLQLERV